MGAIQAYHNNTGSQHQDRFNTLSKEGFRLISLSCYGDDDNPLYAAVWEKKDGPEWRGVHGATPAQYQAKFNELSKQGFNPTIITATGDGDDARFAGVFEKNGKGTSTRFGLREVRNWGESDTVLFDYWNGSARANDMSLISITSYGGVDRGDRRYAAIWQDKGQNDNWYEVTLAEGSDEYQQAFNFWTSEATNSQGQVHSPYTPTSVTVNTDGPRYGAVWTDGNPWGSWMAFHNMSSGGYQNKFNDMGAAGYHPVRVAGGGGEGGSIRFSAIFAK